MDALVNRREILFGLHALGAAAVWPAGAALAQPGAASADRGPAAQSGRGYADGMQPFEVRSMDAAFLPANGIRTFRESQPSPWNASGGLFGARGQIEAWSGGCTDGGFRLFFSGGGHLGTDGVNNGVHCFDWSGTARPAGFTTLAGSRSDPEVVPSDMRTVPDHWFRDGRPTGEHSYSYMAWRRQAGELVRARPLCIFHEASRKWRNPQPILPDGWPRNRIANSGGTMLLAPDERRMLLCNPYGADPLFFDFETRRIILSGNSLWGSSSAGDAHSCYDPKRNRWLAIAGVRNWRTVHFISVDWPAAKWSAQLVTPDAGADLLGGGMGIVFDEDADCFWAFCNKYEARTGKFDRILRLDAKTLQITKHALGEPIQTLAKGQYGRCILLRKQRAIGLVPHFDQPACIVKLPAA